MIERWHDYVSAFPAGVGAETRDVQIPTDGDALFAVRSVMTFPPTLALRWRKPATGQDLQNSLIIAYTRRVDPISGVSFAGVANMLPVWPEVQFPINSTISFDVGPQPGIGPVDNSYVVFRGVKYFEGEPYQAPMNLARRWFTVPYRFTAGAAVLSAYNRIWPGYDYDFIVRSLTYSIVSGSADVFVQVFDQNGKPFSSAPLPIDFVFGNNAGAGSARPGLVNGELVIRAGDEISMSVQTSDAVVIDFQFTGERVDRR